MSAVRALVFLATVGCGRIGFDASTDATTTRPDAPCTTFGPWSAPSQISFGAEDPAQEGDRLQAWGTLDVKFNIYTFRRSSPTDAFGPAVEEAALNTPSDDQDAAPTEDGLDLLFVSDRSGVFSAYETTRASTADPFGPPQLALGLETQPVRSLDVLPSGLILYFEQNGDLYRTERATRTAPFSPPVMLGLRVARFPSVSANELEIYYSDTSIEAMYVRTRASTAEAFSAETPLALPTNPMGHDLEISADGTELWYNFSSANYAVTRSCL